MSSGRENALPPKLQPRGRAEHKGSFGTVLIVAGSRDMPGAAILCARAALRSGVGLCRVAAVEPVCAALAVAVPEATQLRLAADAEGRIAASNFESIAAAAAEADCVALGPGWGSSAGLEGLLRAALRDIEQALVLDADALNALSSELGALASRTGATVITPHPGEAARLLALDSTDSVQGDRAAVARRLARESRSLVVLKGSETIVDDATRVFVNASGNPGMATAGSGDVLTGVVAARVAVLAASMRRAAPPDNAMLDEALFEASCTAVHVHGLAGDLAVRGSSQAGLIAGDLVDWLPQAWGEREE